MKKSKQIKLDIITNYIEWYTTDDKERDELIENAALYVKEDWVDEIANSPLVKYGAESRWGSTPPPIAKIEQLNRANNMFEKIAEATRPQGQMTTTEKNTLIAEFLGYTLRVIDGDDELTFDWNPLENEGEPILEYLILHATPDCLEFDASWDWLMPVVEKIESHGFEVIIAEQRVKIRHNTDHSIEEVINVDIIGTKREAVHKAVVEFVTNFVENNMKDD